MEFFTYLILFFMGIFFGSFFTLAVYRIPRGENILYKHSYCPNCNHRLGTFDLIPVLSYLFLRGKCRYCHEKVRIRYLLLELLAGIVFALYGYVTEFNILFADTKEWISLFAMFLYLVGIFILAGIDKEKKEVQSSVLWYELFVVIGYMIYICTLNRKNAYIYVIYLAILILILLFDITLLRKNTKPNYWTRIVILFMAMLMFNGIMITAITLGILMLFIITIILSKMIKQKIHKFKQIDNLKKHQYPIAFWLCVSNIISILIVNLIK